LNASGQKRPGALPCHGKKSPVAPPSPADQGYGFNMPLQDAPSERVAQAGPGHNLLNMPGQNAAVTGQGREVQEQNNGDAKAAHCGQGRGSDLLSVDRPDMGRKPHILGSRLHAIADLGHQAEAAMNKTCQKAEQQAEKTWRQSENAAKDLLKVSLHIPAMFGRMNSDSDSSQVWPESVAEQESDACTLAANLTNVTVGVDAGAALAVNGDYHWLRSANGPEDRFCRKEIASLSIAACRLGRYTFAGQRCSLHSVTAMVDGTRFIRAREVHVAQLPENRTVFGMHRAGQSIEVALTCSRNGLRVALVNAASTYHVGGGFNSGGRHALEESLNVQTTLFQSMLAARELASREGIMPPRCARPCAQGAWHCHIPETGVVLSPNVEVFRGSTDNGYPFLAAPVELAAIVSVAMPNCNPHMRDAPCDRPQSDSEYQQLLSQKFIATLGAAVLSGADVLVIPDVGCGVYGNNPEEVGKIFGNVLNMYFKGAFKEIHFVGKAEFAGAAQSRCGSGQDMGDR